MSPSRSVGINCDAYSCAFSTYPPRNIRILLRHISEKIINNTRSQGDRGGGDVKVAV